MSPCFYSLRSATIGWFKYRFYLSKAVFFLFGLIFAHGLVDNAVIYPLVSYITETWETENLSLAAAIVNIQDVFTGICILITAHFAKVHSGRFKMVLGTNPVYVVGLVLLFFSTWHRYLLYPTLILIIVGRAGQVPLVLFLRDQLTDGAGDNDQVTARTGFWWGVGRFIGSTISAFFIADKSWRASFVISASVMAAAYVLFCCGFYFDLYKIEETRSPLTILYKVIKGAVKNRNYDYPPTPDGYFQNVQKQERFPPDRPILRWMDKAAIDLPEMNGNPCAVAELKQAKRLSTLIPLWGTFVAYGVVVAAGSTFFVAQSEDMSHQNYVNTLFILSSLTAYASSYLVNCLTPERWSEVWRQRCGLVRIGVGMLFSILGCVAAWQVEVHKLHGHDNMSVAVLAPQFFMLGLMSGLAEDGLMIFVENYFDDEYVTDFAGPLKAFVVAIGKFLNVLWIFIFGTWFGKMISSTDHRRLIKYFLSLTIISTVNFCVYGYVSYRYVIRNELTQEAGLPREEEKGADEPPEPVNALQMRMEDLRQQEDQAAGLPREEAQGPDEPPC